MSSLGEYVHYHWGRYLQYGVTREEEQSGFNPIAVFSSHRREVLDDIAKMKTFTNLKELQDDYNERNKATYDALVEAIKDPSRSQDTLKALLTLVNQSWNEVDINKIISAIQVNEAQQTIVYKPKTLNKNLASNKGAGIKKLSDKQAHYYSTYQRTLSQIATLISNLGLSGNYSKKLQKCQEILESSKFTNAIEAKFNPKASGTLIQDSRLTKKINSLITELQGVATINNMIQASLAEVLGDLAVKGVSSNIKDELEKMLGSMTGRTLTQGSGISISMTTDLDQLWLKGEYESENSPYKNHIVPIKDLSTEGIIGYRFKDIASQVQQKADLSWEIDGELVANISMKNTALDNIIKAEDYVPAVNLQTSALRVYIEGIEASKPGLGTHYMNALASHPAAKDTKAKLKQVGNSARETLLLYMLYSALTGAGQNRIGANADILAIYDKKKKQGAQQVKLFSMKDILQKMAPTIIKQDGVISSPALRSFNLENRFLGEVPSENSATIRITKLLAELSIKNVAMRLPKEKLKDIVI